jgi:hypothetical protein
MAKNRRSAANPSPILECFFDNRYRQSLVG